jgi:hypothetical protein
MKAADLWFYDSSGFGNDGTAINNPSFITGFSGNSIALDGSNDYVQIPSGIVNSCEDHNSLHLDKVGKR